MNKRTWRTLEELADTEEYRKFLEDEFPTRSAEWLQPLNRREVLRLMGASFALAGVTACTRQPTEKIVPYVKQPDQVVPGKPLFFATSMPMGGYGTGLLAESHLGRPTKVEGNPDHPASLGGADAMAQASVLGLYDPDRSQTVRYRGEITNWLNFLGAMGRLRAEWKANGGAGVRILTGAVSSPTLIDQIENLKKTYPNIQWYQWEPVQGTHTGYQTVYAPGKAQVVLSLDSDFLCSSPGSLRYAREFMNQRLSRRLYAVEPTPSVTGSVADHHFAVKQADVEAFALGLGGSFSDWRGAVMKDLDAHRGASLIVAGEHLSPAAQAAVRRWNEAAGNAGNTVNYVQPVLAGNSSTVDSLWSLAKDMQLGKVTMLLVSGTNPLYTAPPDMNLLDAMRKVKLVVHHGGYLDETAEYAHWHIPEAHYLESWSDVRAFDGTPSIVQPLIAPLYDGRTVHELIAAFTDSPDQRPHEIVRQYWSGLDDAAWEKALNDGVIAGQPAPAAAPARAGDEPSPSSAPASGGLELVLRPDPFLWDGRFANNGWLLELPRPQSKLTWDNAAYISPATAQRLGVETENLVELEYRGTKIKVPVYVQPGQADECVTLHLGWGRKRAGRVGNDAGVNAYVFRYSDALWGGPGLQVRKVEGKYPLASTQGHFHIEGRPIVLGLEELKRPEIHEAVQEPEKLPSLYPEYTYAGYKWGMVINQNACTGCSACVAACVAENNIPVVGKDQVLRGREMHWIRIDRYYFGNTANPEVHNQPMLCQHCEKAPCEIVCPVAATVHSNEGLNEMVYNRCVGTRYCSNNCPYKVRRFNFLLYSDWYTQSLYGMRNPDVTVRSRGVMEKCTYCVQRIQEAKIEAEKQNRPVRDLEILTACQQACPTNAIVFGNLNDENALVTKMRKDPLNYSVLGDLNTRPRTTYLAAQRNHNPEIQA